MSKELLWAATFCLWLPAVTPQCSSTPLVDQVGRFGCRPSRGLDHIQILFTFFSQKAEKSSSCVFFWITIQDFKARGAVYWDQYDPFPCPPPISKRKVCTRHLYKISAPDFYTPFHWEHVLTWRIPQHFCSISFSFTKSEDLFINSFLPDFLI